MAFQKLISALQSHLIYLRVISIGLVLKSNPHDRYIQDQFTTISQNYPISYWIQGTDSIMPYCDNAILCFTVNGRHILHLSNCCRQSLYRVV
jgi:hypothetical protein